MKWLSGLRCWYRKSQLLKLRETEAELQSIETEIARLQLLEVLDELKEELRRREDSRNEEVRRIREELRSLGVTESEIDSMTAITQE